jgi:hypothetical protein
MGSIASPASVGAGAAPHDSHPVNDPVAEKAHTLAARSVFTIPLYAMIHVCPRHPNPPARSALARPICTSSRPAHPMKLFFFSDSVGPQLKF